MVAKIKISLVLLDIRSVHNVGAMFRTADAAGISKIFLVGTTPTPLDRFGRVREDIHKAALGAELTVPWEYVADAGKFIGKLKKDGVEIVALEQSETSVDYKKYKLPKQKGTVFIVGTEALGIPEVILKQVDAIIEIPMRGVKESLNVTTALGIALFRILNI
jgi:tRNA G18 (ribose-2'-O)-methylase SpoU